MLVRCPRCDTPTGSIPIELGKLGKLKNFNLSRNQLKGEVKYRYYLPGLDNNRKYIDE